MNNFNYIGFDIHKKGINFCAKAQDGVIVDEGKIAARRGDVQAWAKARSRPWVGAMEATLFTGWIYDELRSLAQELKVAHPAMLKAIAASKKKNDRIDARKIADLLRCDLLPECYMASSRTRELRRLLRYRNLVVRQAYAHEEPHCRDGDGHTLQQTTFTWRSLLRRIARKFAGDARIVAGTTMHQPQPGGAF